MLAVFVLIILTITSLGLLFAMILYFVSQKFKVEEKEEIDIVESCLPGANCGACGFAGCRAFATAFVNLKVYNSSESSSSEFSLSDSDKFYCPVGGEKVMKAISEELNISVEKRVPQVAVLRCNGSCDNRTQITEYEGFQSCKVKATLYVGDMSCNYGCLACGDCVVVCNFGAMTMDSKTHLPVIDQDKCTSCGACVQACPRHLIELRNKGPKNMRVYVACMNQEKGSTARKSCKVACIACGLCYKVCSHEAIVLENNIAYIDPNKCKLCRQCVIVCPSLAIRDVNFLKEVDRSAKNQIMSRIKKEVS